MEQQVPFPLMTDEELREELDKCVAQVEHLFAAGDMDQFVPMLIIHKWVTNGVFTVGKIKAYEPGVDVMILANFDYELRHQILTALGGKIGLQRQAVRAVFFLHEAWFSLPDAEGRRRFEHLEDDPERQEGVMVTGMSVDRKNVGALIFCKRTAENKLVVDHVDHVDRDVQIQANELCLSVWQGYVGALRVVAAGMALDE